MINSLGNALYIDGLGLRTTIITNQSISMLDGKIYLISHSFIINQYFKHDTQEHYVTYCRQTFQD